MEWIKCADRLPGDFREVLVWVDGHRSPSWRNSFPAAGWYDGDIGQWHLSPRYRGDISTSVNVTAWAEIVVPE